MDPLFRCWRLAMLKVAGRIGLFHDQLDALIDDKMTDLEEDHK